jgi:hypothetical protein
MMKKYCYILLLFMVVACGQKATQPVVEQEPTTEIVFLTEKIHDFGVCYKPELMSYDFVFRNVGKIPYIIKDIESSCGCLAVEYPKYPVQPGATDTIHVVYDGNGFKSGYFTKRCDVYSNATDSIYSLRIQGVYSKSKEEEYLKGQAK